MCDFRGCGKMFNKEIRFIEYKWMYIGEVNDVFLVF